MNNLGELGKLRAKWDRIDRELSIRKEKARIRERNVIISAFLLWFFLSVVVLISYGII